MFLEELISGLVSYLISQPAILTVTISLFIGVFYFIGSIIGSNNWQYKNSSKESKIFLGFMFISELIFIPSFLLWLFLNLISIWINVESYLSLIPSFVYLIGLFVYFFLIEKESRAMSKRITNFESTHSIKSLIITRFGDLRYLFILANYGLVINYQPINIIFLLIFNLLIVCLWAHLSTLHYQTATGYIKTSSKKNLEVRFIEFLERGSFLKVQEKKTKDVIVIPTSEIKIIKLIDKKPNLKTFIEQKIDRIKIFKK